MIYLEGIFVILQKAWVEITCSVIMCLMCFLKLNNNNSDLKGSHDFPDSRNTWPVYLLLAVVLPVIDRWHCIHVEQRARDFSLPSFRVLLSLPI